MRIAVLTICCLLCFTHPAKASVNWWKIALCETGHIGDSQDGKPRWDWGSKHRHLEGKVYEGGVGFYASTWMLWAKAVGVYRQYPHAFLAPPLIQIKVAKYGFAHGGYWGCIREV